MSNPNKIGPFDIRNIDMRPFCDGRGGFGLDVEEMLDVAVF